MYGQMTPLVDLHRHAASCRAPTKTFASLAEKHYGGDLKGRIVLPPLGGMGGPSRWPSTMNGGVALWWRSIPKRIARRLQTGYGHTPPTRSTKP